MLMNDYCVFLHLFKMCVLDFKFLDRSRGG
jgi:hypothetical protein